MSMCGIFGAVGFGKDLNHCLDQIVYRGPDDWGEYFCQDHQVYPDVSIKSAKVYITVGNATNRRVSGTLKISAGIFLVLLGVIAVSAWISGDSRDLPFEYEGFD